MRLFEKYVYPKIYNSVVNGVNSTAVRFDECVNPSLFNEHNMIQLCNFINKEIRVSKGVTTCKMNKSQYIGNRYEFVIQWT